jgi:hypothetical protein
MIQNFLADLDVGWITSLTTGVTHQLKINYLMIKLTSEDQFLLIFGRFVEFVVNFYGLIRYAFDVKPSAGFERLHQFKNVSCRMHYIIKLINNHFFSIISIKSAINYPTLYGVNKLDYCI